MPVHSQTSSLRSRVTPGVSWTTAARADEAVDERRLADVRKADDRDRAGEVFTIALRGRALADELPRSGRRPPRP